MSSFPVPEALADHARTFYESGREPATPKLAATVVLLRPAPLRVYMIRRAATMAFASGMYAFPGGSVDPRDTVGPREWIGPSDVDWSGRLAQPVAQARAVVCAAVRELFEESGVLLAPVGDTSGWEAQRRALVSRELSLSELFDQRGVAVRGDLLAPWARWVTPEFEPRRYDTYFFLALLPEGQQARDVSGEADHTMWVRPVEALTGHAEGRLAMLPPTLVTLRDLAAHRDIASVLGAAAQRDSATAVMPRLAGDHLVI